LGGKTELDRVRYETAVANRTLSVLGLSEGSTQSRGHAGLRLPSDPNMFAVKGRGYAIDALAAMRPEDMVVCNLEGHLVDGPPGAVPCNEVTIYTGIFKARPDVQAIVHVHPRYTVLLTVLGVTPKPVCNEGAMLVRRPLPLWRHSKLVQTAEEGDDLAATLGNHKAVLMLGHGAVTVGKDLEEAVMHMVNLEEQARMNYLAYCAAGPDYPGIPDELTEENVGRPLFHELPHFAGLTKPPRTDGAWRYYSQIAAQGI
jgi:L-fuculose-phosphate aldolase